MKRHADFKGPELCKFGEDVIKVQMDRQIDNRGSDRQIDIIEVQIDRQTDRQIDVIKVQMGRQIDRQIIEVQIDRQI